MMLQPWAWSAATCAFAVATGSAKVTVAPGLESSVVSGVVRPKMPTLVAPKVRTKFGLYRPLIAEAALATVLALITSTLLPLMVMPLTVPPAVSAVTNGARPSGPRLNSWLPKVIAS
jgi:hypothetical protein